MMLLGRHFIEAFILEIEKFIDKVAESRPPFFDIVEI
jgi:hypothetical protein